MPRSVPDQPLSEYLAEGFMPLAARVRRAADQLALDGTPEALHALRVQIRRLRSALRAARPVFGKFHVRAIERALGRIIDLTNPARDVEVLLPRLRDAGLGPEVERELAQPLTRWEKHARRARGRLDEALATGALNQPLDWLEALLALPVRPGRDGSAIRMAREAVREQTEDFISGLDHVPDHLEDAETLHELRLNAKRLRYLIDFYEPLLNGRLRRMEPLARDMQAALGDLHDLDVLISRLERLRGVEPDARAASLAWARRERRAQLEKVRGKATTALDAARAVVTR